MYLFYCSNEIVYKTKGFSFKESEIHFLHSRESFFVQGFQKSLLCRKYSINTFYSIYYLPIDGETFLKRPLLNSNRFFYYFVNC